MKSITFLVAGILMMGCVANALAISKNPAEAGMNNFNEPISFVERGIEFLIFPNGEFDFNTRPYDSPNANYYRAAGMPADCGVIIDRDRFGQIRRVGNVCINYDYNNRVSRIGNVFLQYTGRTLVQVGGLQIIYNRGAVVNHIGYVNECREYDYYKHGKGHAYGHYKNHPNPYYGPSDNRGYFKKGNERGRRG